MVADKQVFQFVTLPFGPWSLHQGAFHDPCAVACSRNPHDWASVQSALVWWTIQTLQSFAWILNLKKSTFDLTYHLEYLGLVIDMDQARVSSFLITGVDPLYSCPDPLFQESSFI